MNGGYLCRSTANASFRTDVVENGVLEMPAVTNGVRTMPAHSMGRKHSPSLQEQDPEAAAKERAADADALAALILRGPDANRHAALRVASKYDSLFSDDPFGIYRTSPFQTPLWEMLLSYRRVFIP
jgi:hypothetical protein